MWVSAAEQTPSRGWTVDGRYRLIEQIADSGNSVVWRAEHVRLGQEIAVKLVEPTKADRFLREAKVAAAIKHRHVVQILDVGTYEGWPYMAMELLDGLTLHERLHGGPLELDDVVRVTAQILGGLAAVHDAGMAHRDLKPENVILQRDSDGEYPKLLDFGISKRVDSETGPRLRSVVPTTESVIVGTPEYMSPEQARNLPNIDRRTDVFSMGSIVYEMLTGCRAFEGKTTADVLIRVATTEPTPLRALRPDLDPAVDEFIAQAMSKDPAKRFRDARQMRHALLAMAHRVSSKLVEEGRGAAAKKLSHAASAAYEPGDSGVIFVEQHSMRSNPEAATVSQVPPSSVADIESDVIRTISGEPPRPATESLSLPPTRSYAIVAAVVLLLLGGGVAYVLTSDDAPRDEAQAEPTVQESAAPAPAVQAETAREDPVEPRETAEPAPPVARVEDDAETAPPVARVEDDPTPTAMRREPRTRPTRSSTGVQTMQGQSRMRAATMGAETSIPSNMGFRDPGF